MFLTTLLFFIIPWTIGILHLHRKDKKLIPVIGSFASVTTYIINEAWFYFEFGEIYPFPDQKTLSALPFNIGLYPIVGSYMIFFVKKNKYSYLIVFLTALFLTLAEFAFLLKGCVVYTNGWNIYWTYLAYLSATLSGYWFYLYSKKMNILT